MPNDTYTPSQMAAAIGTIGKAALQAKTVPTVTQNGDITVTPDSGHDGMSQVTVPVAVPNSYAAGDEGKVVSSGALVAQTAHADVAPTTADQTIDVTGNNSVKVKAVNLPVLSNQAGAGDIRYGKSVYNNVGGTVDGTLQDAHQRVPVFWDDANSVFLLDAAVLNRVMATLAADGALVGYLLCTGSGAPALPIPVELTPSGEVQGMIVLTGGVTTGSNDDKYVAQARINPATGAIDAERTYYIRAITALSRNLADWLADGDYLSLFLLA